MKCEIYKFDLVNRFPDYTFTQNECCDCLEYVVTDDTTDDAVVETVTRYGEESVVCAIRKILVGGDEILPLLTTTQRDTLSSVDEGTQIFNITTSTINVYYDGVWV
jgi:hypothetical protein